MKHLALATILTVGSALVLGSATTVHAQGNGNNAGLEIPVTGTGPAADLTGTFTLQRFITTADGVCSWSTRGDRDRHGHWFVAEHRAQRRTSRHCW